MESTNNDSSKIRWTDDMKHELAKITLIRVGYKVTGGKDGLKMET